MFDINFYRKSYPIFADLCRGGIFEKSLLAKLLENYRSKEPTVFNIGTTNICNMSCYFCPRTKNPPKVLKSMDVSMFSSIAKQIKPFNDEEWALWEGFVREIYKISKFDMGENHFFLYILPRVVQLHLFGEPLLDKNIDKHIKILTDEKLDSYFSCNPSNMNITKLEKCFDNGLGFIKFSVDSIFDDQQKKIRGKKSNFSTAFKNIIKLAELKEKMNYKTQIIVTMIDLGLEDQEQQFVTLSELLKDTGVYYYLKSQNSKWYNSENQKQNISIHWNEPCRSPWVSMSFDPFGNAVECQESYESHYIFGNVKNKSLYDIWNGEDYKNFREKHIFDVPERCAKKCDMKIIGEFCL